MTSRLALLVRTHDSMLIVPAPPKPEAHHELKSAVCVKKATMVFLLGIGSHASTRTISSPFDARLTLQLLSTWDKHTQSERSGSASRAEASRAQLVVHQGEAPNGSSRDRER